MIQKFIIPSAVAATQNNKENISNRWGKLMYALNPNKTYFKGQTTLKMSCLKERIFMGSTSQMSMQRST
tara:strand:- start:2669 stop:2875 length:207 start_codon:yes stop_codon:yes gene_type:complete